MSKWTNDYERNHYDRIPFQVPKGAKEMITECAKASGLSVNKFIAKCIEKETGLSLSLDKELPWIKNENREDKE